MLLDHFSSQRPIVLEWGRREFPGFGRRMFGQRHYEYMVGKLNEVSDPQARQWLTDWIADLFQRDNPRFKEELFKRAVAEKRQYNASPTFEQRHFYYLAQAVREVADQHVHDFVRDWLARVIGGTNYKFNSRTWDAFCTRNRQPPEPTQPVEEQYGGARSHTGFGKHLFRRPHLRYIFARVNGIEDKVVRDHLTDWFAKIFKLDNPEFDYESFRQVRTLDEYTPVVFQARHFYFLAHEVAEIPDIHERTFVCDWLASALGRTNQNFNGERWREYCHLPATNYQRRDVAHYRAKARGDEVIPERPYDERQRLEREAAEQLTPDEFHQHATCSEEEERAAAGHELVYLRTNRRWGRYVIYDKTAGDELYCHEH